MATRAGVGFSDAPDPARAGDAAARAAVEILGGEPDLLVVFATTGYDQPRVLDAIHQVAGAADLVGCSGEGVISTTATRETDHAVAVMAVRSDALSFKTFLLPRYSDDPARRGAELADEIVRNGGENAVGLLLFPDGLTGNCTDLLGALERNLPLPILTAGGTSADAMTFERTYQYAGGEIASDAVSALLIHGRGRLEVAVSHGCMPIGLEREVTRSEGGWLYEIDGLPAWSVFKEYLDGDPQDLNAEGIVHLCLGEPLDDHPADYPEYAIRTPLRLDQSNGALFFPGGSIRTGQKIRLTRRDQQRIRESARDCAERIVESQHGAQPVLVLQFDCAGRDKVLFGACAAEQIVQPLQEALGGSTPWIGFHTYGEIAPIGERLYYHHYTVVLGALYDG